MWIVSLVMGGLFGLLGIAGLLVGGDDALLMIIAAGLWLKVAAIEKAVLS